jgi:hypothetical protein
MLVPEDALAFLAIQGISFTVEGPAKYDQNGSALRGSALFDSRWGRIIDCFSARPHTFTPIGNLAIW